MKGGSRWKRKRVDKNTFLSAGKERCFKGKKHLSEGGGVVHGGTNYLKRKKGEKVQSGGEPPSEYCTGESPERKQGEKRG